MIASRSASSILRTASAKQGTTALKSLLLGPRPGSPGRLRIQEVLTILQAHRNQTLLQAHRQISSRGKFPQLLLDALRHIRTACPVYVFMATFARGYPMTLPLRECLAATVMLCGVAATTAQPRPVVVELFTSQGCSSCPPADAYVGKLSARSDVLALSFHVDYWDDLGWRDRFALAQSVERQNLYARNLRRSSVYTPQLVVDGREDQVGSDGKAIAKALEQTRDSVPVGVSVHDAEVLVQVGAQAGFRPSDVTLVAYLRHAVSAVGRGENAGRTLDEFNIVRNIRTLGVWKGQAENFHVPVSSLSADTTDVAVLVQPSGQGPIIGAAAHALR